MQIFLNCDAETGRRALMGFLLANTYFEAGMREYQQFAGLFHPDPDSRGGLANTSNGTEHYSFLAAGMLLAFSCELYLKSMAGQQGLEVPWGHRIKEDILVKFTDLMTEDLRSRFEARRGSENYLAVSLGQSTRNGPSGRDSFDDAVAQVSNLFVDLRYVHETLQKPRVADVDFSNLIWLSQAAREAVEEFRGQTIALFQSSSGRDR